jgi:hypothetical protein
MTYTGINWYDVAYQTGAGINWGDLQTSSTSRVNWSDMANMTSQNINWQQLSLFSNDATDLVNNVQSIYDKLGVFNSSSTTDLFGKINKLLDEVGTGNISGIVSTLGSPTDTVASNTLFGDINEIQTKTNNINTTTGNIDTTTAALTATIDTKLGTSSQSLSVFGQMDIIQDFAEKSKKSAQGALGIITDVQKEVGFTGKTPNAYGQMQLLEKYIKDIQSAAIDLGGRQEATSQVAQQLVGMVQNLLNEQAKLSGLENTGLMIENLSKQQSRDMEKVYEKFDEINVKIRALQEAMKIDDIVVKTWFESEE